MIDSNGYFGVSMIMSRQDQLTSTPSSDWVYTLLGHYDEMKLQVKDDNDDGGSQKFYFSHHEYLETLSATNKRKEFQPETQKFFFIVENKQNENGYSKDLLKAYSKPDEQMGEKSFIALVAVKLHPLYLKTRAHSMSKSSELLDEEIIDYFKDKSECGKNFLDKDITDYFIMRSLGIDEFCVLFVMKEPWYSQIMEFVRYLEISNSFPTPATSVENAKSAIEKLLSVEYPKLEVRSKARQEWLSKVNAPHNRSTENQTMIELKDLIEDVIKSIDDNSYTMILDTLKNKWTELLKTNTSYDVLDWFLQCIDSIRVCGRVPSVLQAHTVIGYRSKLHEDLKIPYKENPLELRELAQEKLGVIDDLCGSMKDRRRKVDIEFTLRPGASVESLKSAFIECIGRYNDARGQSDASIDPELFKVSVTAGRSYCVYSNVLTFSEMLWICTNLLFAKSAEDAGIGSNKIFQYSSCRLHFNSKPNCCTKITDEAKEDLLSEDIALATAWMDEQYELASRLFNIAIEACQKEPEYKFLLPLIREISLLHGQACQRFFWAATWSEFKYSRIFFSSLFEEIEEIFFYMTTGRYDKNFHKSDILDGLNDALKLCLDKLTMLFNERMTFGLTIHENTRPGLYATGAYEALLRRYSDWIQRLTSILSQVERNEKEPLGFMLTPVERDGIHSQHLFPIRQGGKGRIIVYNAPLGDLLELDYTLITLIHEVGHHWGDVCKSDRRVTFLSMVSMFFSLRIESELRSGKLEAMPRGTLVSAQLDIYEKMKNYLLNGTASTNDRNIMGLSYLCRILWNEFIEYAVDHKTVERLESEKSDLLNAFAEIYYQAGMASLVSHQGATFAQILLSTFEDTIGYCRTLIRECYADLIMIRVLDLTLDNAETFFSTLFKGMDKSTFQRQYAFPVDKQRALSLDCDGMKGIIVFRLLSALMVMSDSGADEKQLFQDNGNEIRKLLNSVPEIIVDKKHLWEHREDIAPDMEKLANRDYENFAVALPRAWGIVSSHLLLSGRRIRNRLLSLSPSAKADLKNIRSLFAEMCDSKDHSFQQLANFLDSE